MEEIVNKVAKSGLITIDLEEMYPSGERAAFDIKESLWQGLVLKEKDFRDYLKAFDWSTFQDKYVAVYCSADAIIPHWAFMLIASKLQGISKLTFIGSSDEMERYIFREMIEALDVEAYRDQRIVIKGCSNKPVPQSAYGDLVTRLQPYAKSIMFGEPCSTVPVYKKSN